MTSSSDGLVGSCKCGKVTIRQRHAGGLIVQNCHCSNCRKQSEHAENKDFVATSIDWCCNISTTGPIDYACTASVPWSLCVCQCLRRGTCKECKSPVVTYAYGSYTGFATIPVEAMTRGDDARPYTMPAAACNIHYGSGLKNGPHDIPSYHGDVCSFFHLCCNLLGPVLKCKSCCCGAMPL